MNKPPILAQFDNCVSEIYASYVKASKIIAGKRDKDIRNPENILSIARKLNLLPDPEKTIKITGSKGKGTTTRLIAQLLERNTSGKKIGLLISPESLDHNDRIRINSTPMSKTDFVRHYQSLCPWLEAVLVNTHSPKAYLSPSGIFLLIGLAYLKEQAVDYFVLETGRGALYDEVGNIKSRLAVITSIFEEHLDKLGPSLTDVAFHKTGISKFSETVIIHEDVEHYFKTFGFDNYIVKKDLNHTLNGIAWISKNYSLAKAAVELMLNHNNLKDLPSLNSPSFFPFKVGETSCWADGAIALDCLDKEFLKTLKRPVFICSFPDDKRPVELVGFLQHYSPDIFHVVVVGEKTSLNYKETETKFNSTILTSADSLGTINLAEIITELRKITSAETCYFIGTQTFLRIIKKSLLESGQSVLPFL